MQALHATGRRVESLRVGPASARSRRRGGSRPVVRAGALESRSRPARTHAGRIVGRPLRGYTIHDRDRRGGVRAGVRGHPARHRPTGGDQGDPPGSRRFGGVRPCASRPRRNSSPGWSTRTSSRSTTTGASRCGLPRVPPARRRHGPRLGDQRGAVVARRGSHGSSRRSAARSCRPTPPASSTTT